MSTTSLPRIPQNADLERTKIIVNQMLDELDWLLGGFVDSKNVREIGGWLVSKNRLESKDSDVGMSTEDTGADDIRFWAGDSITGAPKFKVLKSGKMFATDGEFSGTITGSTITGGTIRSGGDSTDRIELSAGKFRGLTAANQITGMYFDIGTIPGTGIADIGFYHNGTKLMEFYDDITKFTIKAASGATGLTIGGAAATTYPAGNWDFLGSLGVSGLHFSYTGTTSSGGTDGHSHAFSVSGSITRG